MEDRIVREESPMEFFREQLTKAMEHQRISVSAFSEWYIVNLLTAGAKGPTLPSREPGYDETPLALLYVRALEASRFERARLLRLLGDTALFVSGFFADSLARKLVDLDYYRAMGGRAYASLSQDDAGALGGSVFRELSSRFMEFTDLLQEISESSRLATTPSVARLYERWLATRSRRAGVLLAERGVAPVLASREGLE